MADTRAPEPSLAAADAVVPRLCVCACACAWSVCVRVRVCSVAWCVRACVCGMCVRVAAVDAHTTCTCTHNTHANMHRAHSAV